MREIRVTIASPEAADHGVAELWAVDELIGYTLLLDGDLMLASSLAMTEPVAASHRTYLPDRRTEAQRNDELVSQQSAAVLEEARR